MKPTGRLGRYLADPFPKQRAFGPYAWPGRIVHIPVLIMLAALGWMLLGWHDTARWLVVVYIVAGIYLGRDLAILAHYVLPITLIVVALPVVALTVLLPTLRDMTATIRGEQLLWPGIAVAVALVVVFALRVRATRVVQAETDQAPAD